MQQQQAFNPYMKPDSEKRTTPGMQQGVFPNGIPTQKQPNNNFNMAELQNMNAVKNQAIKGNMGLQNYQNEQSALLIDRDEGFTATSLSSPKGRNLFIRKVFILTAIMLSITAGFVTLVMISQAARQFLMTNVWLVIIALILSLVTVFTLACVPGVARSVPINFILLFVFTICESILV